MPVTLVRERDDIVGPVSEIALKALQDVGVGNFDRLFDETVEVCLAGRNGQRQRPSEGDDNSILRADQKIGIWGFAGLK